MTGDSAPRSDDASTATRIPRIEWLDGVRALAASYVMLHHIYLGLFTGFPENPGPFGLGWLMYGQLAVVVFIVVSGFSLGLGPAHSAGELKGGASGFFRRRAWRILPALLGGVAVRDGRQPFSPCRTTRPRSECPLTHRARIACP